MKIRLPVSHDPARGYFVDMPSYNMIPGTFAPTIPGTVDPDGIAASADPADILALHISVECEIPDADCDGEEISIAKMARRYKLPAGYTPPARMDPAPPPAPLKEPAL